jgi:hypothetical protein
VPSSGDAPSGFPAGQRRRYPVPDLAGDRPVFISGSALDRSPQVSVNRYGNLLSAVLLLRHGSVLALSRGTKREFFAPGNARPERLVAD